MVSIMKLNSNTIKLSETEHKKIEAIIKKVASENNIKNVKTINISLNKDNGVVKFKEAIRHWLKDYTPSMYNVIPEKYEGLSDYEQYVLASRLDHMIHKQNYSREEATAILIKEAPQQLKDVTSRFINDYFSQSDEIIDYHQRKERGELTEEEKALPTHLPSFEKELE